jgi:hypothetical protein
MGSKFEKKSNLNFFDENHKKEIDEIIEIEELSSNPNAYEDLISEELDSLSQNELDFFNDSNNTYEDSISEELDSLYQNDLESSANGNKSYEDSILEELNISYQNDLDLNEANSLINIIEKKDKEQSKIMYPSEINADKYNDIDNELKILSQNIVNI